MNKIAKASIAGAAGVVLLMGGAGSLAYWNNQQSIASNGTTVTAGQLYTTTSAGANPWTVTFVNAAGTTVTTNANLSNAQIVAYRFVPGNKITYTQTFNVTASGNDLLYRVAVANPTDTTGNTLAPHFVAANSASVQNSSGTVVSPNANGSYTAAQGVSKIVVTQTFTWSFGSTAPTSNTSGDNDANTSTATNWTIPSATATGQTPGLVTLTQVDS